jgi:predicted acylesterase/phospholipase RssA
MRASVSGASRSAPAVILGLCAVALAGCAGPLTTADTGVTGCAGFLERPSDFSLPAATGPVPPGGRVVNMLVLSGGGKYGAYGAGFLKGWQDAFADPVQRAKLGPDALAITDFTIVTGISTGSMLQSFVSVGTAGSPAGAAAIEDAFTTYTNISDASLYKQKGLISSLMSNGTVDIRGRLDTLIDTKVGALWSNLRALPDDRRSLTGIVNLDNGQFYTVDLIAVAKSDTPNARRCYTEAILASSAVPLAFPPRFIDNSPYVDGGVRFGAFLAEPLATSLMVGPDPVKVNLRVIMNNNLSANDPSDDAARAVRCDASGPAQAAADCGPLKNDLLTIARRSAGDILVAQVYRDSVYRLQRELEARGALQSSGFVWVSNEAIAAEGCKRATKDNFDTAFMRCLARIGQRDGFAQAWKSFDVTPSIVPPGG